MESTRRIYRVERKDIAYLRFLLESYDGTAVVCTLDPSAAIIEVMISPGCEGLVEEILRSLQGTDGLRIFPLSRGTESVDAEVR